MAKMFVKTVLIEVPLPFDDSEGQAFADYVELSLDGAIEAAAKGVIDAARSANVPLADVASVSVTD